MDIKKTTFENIKNIEKIKAKDKEIMTSFVESLFDFSNKEPAEKETNKKNNDWQNLEIKDKRFLGFLWKTGEKQIKTSDGKKINFRNLNMDNMQVKENKKTGEIILLDKNGIVEQINMPWIMDNEGVSQIPRDAVIKDNFPPETIEKFIENGTYKKLSDYLINADKDTVKTMMDLFSNPTFATMFANVEDVSEIDGLFELNNDELSKILIMTNTKSFNDMRALGEFSTICDVGKYDDEKFSNLIKNLNDPTVQKLSHTIIIQNDFLENIAKAENIEILSEEECTEFLKCLYSPYSIDAATNENYFKFNMALHGKPVDMNLYKELQEMGKQYGVNIRLEHNISSDPNNKEAEVYITQENIDSIETALAQMKEKNINMPKELFISDMIGNGGVYMRENNDAIAINANTFNLYPPEIVIPHEVAHMNDFNKHDIPQSKEKAYDLGIISNKEELYTEPLEKIQFNGDEITKDEISGIIREYACSDIAEYVAEISTLLVNDVIIKNENGEYTIDKNKIPENYCTNWKGTAEDQKSLNEIMNFYEYLIA